MPKYKRSVLDIALPLFSPDDDRQWLSPQEASRLLSFSSTSLAYQASRGRLTPYQFKGQVYYKREDVAKYLTAKSEKQTEARAETSGRSPFHSVEQAA